MDRLTKLTPTTPHSQWLWRADTQKLLALFNADGATTRCVGGCVRDTLLGCADAETEIDMATTLSPDEGLARLSKAKYRWLKTGFAYGTITAMLPAGDGWRGYEITTLRRDVASDGRHAQVQQTDDWAVDAARRDFTINALYADADGTLADPTGVGFADLAARRVRFIGDAGARVAEDYLRVLRYFRFHFALSPAQPMAGDIMAICAAAHAGVQGLSPERKHVELMCILQGDNADKALAQLGQARLLLAILGIAAINHKRLARVVAATSAKMRAKMRDGPMVRLAAMLNIEDVKPVAQALRLSKKQSAALAAALAPPQWHNLEDLRTALYFEGAEAIAQQALLRAASGGDADLRDLCAQAQAQAAAYMRPVFPLTGAMMKAVGMAEGPAMGAMYKELEKWWVAKNFPNQAALEKALATAFEKALAA